MSQKTSDIRASLKRGALKPLLQKTPRHPSHQAQLNRLRRCRGQIDGIERMIEARRYCPEICAQIRATRAALSALESEILKTHLKTCVAKVFDSGTQAEREEKIDEIIALTSRKESAGI